jgi:hypothetical protein
MFIYIYIYIYTYTYIYIGEGDDGAIAMAGVSDGAALLRDLTQDDAALLKVGP